MNNFFDGERQDGFDLVTGAWTAADAPAARTSLQKDIRPTLVKRVGISPDELNAIADELLTDARYRGSLILHDLRCFVSASCIRYEDSN